MTTLNFNLTRQSGSGLLESNPSSGGGGQSGFHTINGSGFGTKTTGTPYFDDFESRTLGQAVSSSLGGESGLNISNPDFVSIVNSGSFSGTKCVKMDYAAATVFSAAIPNNSSPQMFPKIYHKLAAASRYGYAAFKIKFSGTNSSNYNIWKFGRFTNDSADAYGGINSITFQYYGNSGTIRPGNYSGAAGGDVTPGQNWSTTPDTINSSTENPLYNPATVFTPDVWHLYEVEFDLGDLNTANAIAEERWDKTLTVRHGNGSSSMTFRTTANPNGANFIMSPICGLDNYSNIVMLMDEAYLDGSRCRVVMTDSATYSSWTKWSIQPIATYNNNLITAVKKRGQFNIGDTAYLHVFNSSGVRVHTTASFLVTADNA